MFLYVDTNILISYFNTNDRAFSETHALFAVSSLDFTTGIITLLEFESVLGRLRKSNRITFDPNVENTLRPLSPANQIRALTKFCFNSLPIRIVPVSALETLVFNRQNYKIENTFLISHKICPELLLRTLDTIQIAAAVKIKHYEGIDIQYFLTNDQEILNKGNEIYSHTQILPISSTDLTASLKINP
ncbi:MAG: hypothetical protein RBG13Loki_2743 [Promethearchaeota archaeon CR_4]|nr:MAG: hypothetical protein RBG13Loki_2743 [Candidatus Lokiarchaeota archaeon CR_4]